MKALPFQIPKSQHAFRIQVDHEPHFYDLLHRHPEFQVTLIRKSSGSIFLGDHIGHFSPGDVFVIGSDVPHVFRNDAVYYDQNTELNAEAISLFFTWNSFGEGFFDLPEMMETRRLLEGSQRGLVISGNTSLAKKIDQIEESRGIGRVLTFFEILQELVSASEAHYLSAELPVVQIKDSEGNRMRDILRFTMKEFHRPIRLEEVSEVANMTNSSFCRYFKQRTRKSYIDFLTEVRIHEACKLLQDKSQSIADICYLSGFSNLSNFNRKFKAIMGHTPREYRTALVN